MYIGSNQNGRLFLYCPTGAAWGWLCGDAIPRFLYNYCSIHITASISAKSLGIGTFIGAAIGFILSYIVQHKMREYRRIHLKKEYIRMIMIEMLILLAVAGVGVICLKIGYSKYSDFLYPQE